MSSWVCVFAIAVALATLGCSPAASQDRFTVAEVQTIIAKCGAPSNVLILNAGWVTISQPTAGDKTGECTLSALKSTGKTKITVVGNELHSVTKGR